MSKVQKSLIESIDEIGQAHDAEADDIFGDDPVCVVYAVYVMEPDAFLAVYDDNAEWGVVGENGKFLLCDGKIARFVEAEAERAAAWARSQDVAAWAAKIGDSVDRTD